MAVVLYWMFIMICANEPYSHARRFVSLGWVLAMVCFVSPCALAHTSLERYVRECVSISVGVENIDVRIQFSFPADLSLAERRLMDRDGDGKVSKGEKEAYLNDVQTRAEQLLRLSVNGQAVLLIPLEDPVLDLQDEPGIEAHPHELRLAYFARMPKAFGVDGTIALDSGLWTETPLMVSVSMEGAAGIHFHAVDTQGLREPSKDGALFRITEARCAQWEPRNDKHGRQ